MKKKSILVLLGLLVISIFLPAQEETTEQETSKIHHWLKPKNPSFLTL